MKREKCLVCQSNKLQKIIDLGSHPFADTFIPESRAHEADLLYSLICDLCENCGHIQTEYETDPVARYSQKDYSYTSSNSVFSKKHWEDYAKEVSDKLKIKPDSFVVEIGSNDGFLSEQFLKTGNIVIGVDPSPYMAALAKERGVETIIGLFDKSISDKILEKHGKADLVIANNVFNHADNPLEFTMSVRDILKDAGSFVFEQPYWLISVKSRKLDQIYHEHVSYFTVRSASALLEKAGMAIKSAEIVDYHGGSLRVVAQKKENVGEKSQSEIEMIKKEEKQGLFATETYASIMKESLSQRNKFLKRICEIREDGHAIIAVGAAAKGNTFLNFYKLDNSLIDYVTDASPHKKGKYTPATRIPIVGDEIFSKYGKVYALILSWNIANQLKDKLHAINKNIEFLVPEEN